MRSPHEPTRLATMAEASRTVSIETEGEEGPLRGSVLEADGTSHDFEGWLGLLTVLGSLLDAPPPSFRGSSRCPAGFLDRAENRAVMRREELRAAIDRDPEAIVELVMTLSASVAALRAEVDELKRQLGRDSRNSSLPPSRDSPAARAKRPRKGSGRNAGRAAWASGPASRAGRRPRSCC